MADFEPRSDTIEHYLVYRDMAKAIVAFECLIEAGDIRKQTNGEPHGDPELDMVNDPEASAWNIGRVIKAASLEVRASRLEKRAHRLAPYLVQELEQ